jgi:lipopolysaccharide/colanic/teichoic acid biosynthesis glycosyltransferase
LFDVVVAGTILIIVAPILLLIGVAIFLSDFHYPLYAGLRVGQGGRPFRMIKFRSMVVNADRTGVTSTSATDSRITPVGRFVRQFKLDELVQLWNVVVGDMSLVGPRPNVPSGVAVYTSTERGLLAVRPGITDFSSIVFADEGEILRPHPDADSAYDQLIRPWKSRLGLLYIQNQSLRLDVHLIVLTALAVVARAAALSRLSNLLSKLKAPTDLIRVASRRYPLVPSLPPSESAGRSIEV